MNRPATRRIASAMAAPRRQRSSAAAAAFLPQHDEHDGGSGRVTASWMGAGHGCSRLRGVVVVALLSAPDVEHREPPASAFLSFIIIYRVVRLAAFGLAAS